MTREEVASLADKYQAKADRAYRNYQETGITRYDREYRNNDDLASALRIAADSAEDAMTLAALRSTLSYLATRARDLDPDDPEAVRFFLQTLIAEAEARGYIRRDSHG